MLISRRANRSGGGFAAEVEQGLGFQDSLLFGESVKGVQLEFVLAGFVIEVAKGSEIAAGPLGKRHINAAFFSGGGQVAMALAEEVDAHVLGLEINHVFMVLGPGTFVAFLAAERKLTDQAPGGEHLFGRADQLGYAIFSAEDADDVAAVGDPDHYFVIALEKMARTMNVEQLRMKRALKHVEGQLTYRLFYSGRIHCSASNVKSV